MKNLILLTEKRHTVHSNNTNHNYITSIVPNPNADLNTDGEYSEEVHYYALTPNGTVYAINNGFGNAIVWSLDLTTLAPSYDNDYGDNSYFNLTYNEASDALIVLSHKTGNIISIDPTTGAGELIGSFEDYGIVCGEWSDDGEVLALVTFQVMPRDENEEDGVDGVVEAEEGEQKAVPVLMTMNAQFEVLSETTLPPHAASITSSSPSPFTATPSISLEEESIALCWKGDGSLIAITTLDNSMDDGNGNNNNKKPQRVVRIYNAESLELKSIGKSEDGSGKLLPNLLLPLVSLPLGNCVGCVGNGNQTIQWAGSNTSNLLAVLQRKGKKNRNVVFIEPNGLQHGGFKISIEPGEEIVGFEWNAESDLLAVTFLCQGSDTPGEDYYYGKVQLYHRCNYHWYLKHEFNYRLDRLVVGSVKFDATKGYDLITTLVAADNDYDRKTAMEWRHYTFAWDPSTITSTLYSQNLATVVDGKELKFTPLNKALVPPPMCAATLMMSSVVVGVAVVPPSTNYHGSGGLKVVAHLNDGSIVFCGGSASSSTGGTNSTLIANYKPPSILGAVSLLGGSNVDAVEENAKFLEAVDVSCLRQLTVVNVQTVAVPGEGGNSNNNHSVEIYVRILAVACSKPHLDESHMSTPQTKVDSLIDFTVHLIPLLDGSEGGGNGFIANVIRLDSNKLEGIVLRMVHWSDDDDFDQLNASEKGQYDDYDKSEDHLISAIGGALIELTDGTLYEFSSSSTSLNDGVGGGVGMLLPCQSEPMLLEPCPWIAGLRTKRQDRRLIVGLSPRFRLYCGERLLSNASSSFILSPSHEFLSYVTLGSRSQLRFLPLSILLDFDPLMGSDDNLDVLGEGYEPRDVERGSRLVSVLPQKPMVILQLPRGNLEGMFPRALVLPFIMSQIDCGEYGLALDMMRRQKVDMNLIVDMDPERFLNGGGVEQLVGQVKKIDHLNLFIACLVNGDITKWKFRIPFWFRRRGVLREHGKQSDEIYDEESFDFDTKVNQVCSRIRQEMVNAEKSGATPSGQVVADGHFLCPILSTFAKENPPKLESALGLIKDHAYAKFVPSTNTNKKKSPLFADRAQNSIQYLAFLADYELLFNTALGMYNFDLAKAVARNSQMDPKVYLPMLKRLRGLPEFVAKYEVDVRLKRYESALTNLFKSGDGENNDFLISRNGEDHFDKCLSFIEDHKLHHLGLKLFYGQKEKCYRIMVCLGEHLLSENKPDSALGIFLASDPIHYEGAKKAARACGNWKSYFACIVEDNEENPEISDQERRDIASEIATEIADGKGGMNSRREGFVAGARILCDYCQDIDGAVDMLISAEMWFEGRRLAHLHSRKDLVRRVVDAAVSYGHSCISDFGSKAEIFQDANDRYSIVVNIRKEAKREGEQAANEDNHQETGSLFSMASNASNSSVRSNMSGSSIGSVSSVISAGAVSTFSLVGELDSLKHKSKFNKIGRNRKKKRKNKRERNKMKPGSEEELQTLVSTMKFNIIDDQYLPIIVETIQFLAQTSHFPLAREIYDAFKELASIVDKIQSKRIETVTSERKEAEYTARKEGQNFDNIILDCEEEVDNLRCRDLPGVIHDIFSYLIT